MKNERSSAFPVNDYECDLCVVGGGLAGIGAALSAARHGARVVIMQDRPVLGGNASSECRMHICGADRCNSTPHLRETGIVEELRLEALRHNQQRSQSVWDMIMYDKVRNEPNITMLLNCSCLDADMAGKRIASITGWQLTTHSYQRVTARIFADCSGDGILAPLTGADWRMGREARTEFGESIAPEEADDCTMGMTCMFGAREHDTPQEFVPPTWAHKMTNCEDLPYGAKGHGYWGTGYWWIELGGEHHSIDDTELLRDELLKITLGVWDHIKNSGKHDAANWALDWIQFLPAKRESRRFVGDHTLTQLDIETGGRFDDVVAYGGWSMDDHDVAGFRAVSLGRPATIFHPAPAPYGIPYRILYSRNIDNLMFAGRNASCTHAAMSSTRVMATCAVMGQAVGVAAAMAVERNVTPRDIGSDIKTLQQELLADDCYLPRLEQEFCDLTVKSVLKASVDDPEPVRDGIARQVGDDPHSWSCPVNGQIWYEFDVPTHVSEVSLVLDSGMDRLIAMLIEIIQRETEKQTPDVMPKDFRIEGMVDGEWEELHAVKGNYQRHVRFPIDRTLSGLRFTLDKTWGAESSRVYSFSVR